MNEHRGIDRPSFFHFFFLSFLRFVPASTYLRMFSLVESFFVEIIILCVVVQRKSEGRCKRNVYGSKGTYDSSMLVYRRSLCIASKIQRHVRIHFYRVVFFSKKKKCMKKNGDNKKKKDLQGVVCNSYDSAVIVFDGFFGWKVKRKTNEKLNFDEPAWVLFAKKLMD